MSLLTVQAEDGDYNIPSPERLCLLEKLQNLLGEEVTLSFWAACHLCDLNELKLLIQVAEIKPSLVWLAVEQTHTMLRIWDQTMKTSRTSTPRSSPIMRNSPSTSSPSESPAKRQALSVARSKLVRDNADERDSWKCVLTKETSRDVAHIYPYSLLQKGEKFCDKRQKFWQMLRNFWPQEKIDAWQKTIFPSGPENVGIETTANMITLSKVAHERWNQGHFALKPISLSNDKKVLLIQFFWQRSYDVQVTTVSLPTRPSSTKDLDRGHNGIGLVDWSDGDAEKIRSGDVFEMRTNDPVSRPLPSMELLEMQWFLQRVMGMSGAADVWDRDGHWPDDEISNLGLGDVGDDTCLDPDLSDMILQENNTQGLSDESTKHDIEGSEDTSVFGQVV